MNELPIPADVHTRLFKEQGCCALFRDNVCAFECLKFDTCKRTKSFTARVRNYGRGDNKDGGRVLVGCRYFSNGGTKHKIRMLLERIIT